MNKLFAVPTVDKKLAMHFGHCESFAIIDVKDNQISKVDYVNPPEHTPGSFPKFLADKGVVTIIAGGMGTMAKQLFADNNIEVIMGIDAQDPAILVEKYLKSGLESGDNLCDSDENHGHGDACH